MVLDQIDGCFRDLPYLLLTPTFLRHILGCNGGGLCFMPEDGCGVNGGYEGHVVISDKYEM